MDIRLLSDRVLVKQSEGDSVTKGGIVLPDQAKERPFRGVVMAVGSGKVREDGTRQPMEIRAGDEVIYEKYGAQAVRIDHQEYWIVAEAKVMAVMGHPGTGFASE